MAPSSVAPPPPSLPSLHSSQISAHLNSLHSNQDGAGKSLANALHNSHKSLAHHHYHQPASATNGQAPPHYLRPYSTLPKAAGQLVPDYHQHQQHAQHQQPHARHQNPHHLHANLGEQLPAPHSSIYTHIQSGGRPPVVGGGATQASGGYILSVNTDTGETLTSSGLPPPG